MVRGRAWALVPVLLGGLFLPGGAGEPLPKPDWAIPDEPGDVSMGGLPAPGPVAGHVDLVGVQIDGEDETGLYVTFLVDDLRVSEQSGAPVALNFYYLDFQFGPETLRYYLYVNVLLRAAPDAAGVLHAAADDHAERLSICGERACTDQPVEVVLDDANDAIRVWLPKASLLGQSNRQDWDVPAELPSTIHAGDTLRKIRVTARSYMGFGYGTTLTDRAPDQGEAPPYSFRTGAANTIVAVYVPGTDGGLAVEPGLNQSIPFTVKNLAAAKRLLQMEYRIEGPQDHRPKYRAHGPSTIAIPGGQTRNFTFSLDVAAGARPADSVRLVVYGVSLGRPDEVAFAGVRLVPGAVLGPTSNVLYAHAQKFPFLGEPLDQVFCAHPTLLVACREGFLSPLAEDPEASAGERIEGQGRLTVPPVQFFSLGTPRAIASPVAFEAGKPVQVRLKLEAPVQADGVRLSVRGSYFHPEAGPGILFEAADTVNVATTGTVAELTAPIQLGKKPHLPPGSRIVVRVDAYAQQPTSTAAWAAGGVRLVPVETRVTFPLIEPPPELRPVASSSPFQLSVVGDKDDFVNPGEGRLFNVSILNQGSSSHRVDLSAQAVTPGWSAEVRPGTRYELEAGDVVTVGVLVRAPAEAKEGEAGVAWLNATDEAGATVGIPLGLIATTGIDLPDDSESDAGDAEARSKLVEERRHGTPGPDAAFLLAGLVAAAFALRRRKP